MIRKFYLYLASFILIPIVIGDYEYLKEMGFKFWLDPGAEECYHELLEKSSRLYFMYEILNVHTQDDSIIAYLRNTHNNSIITVTNTRQYGHLEFTTNETMSIDICMTHAKADTYVKYLSVYFHVYHVDKALAKIKDSESFDNSSVNAHNTIDSISHYLLISREHQIKLNMVKQKDLYLVEANLLWINRWALTHILIILSCFSFQTYFIKRLFKTSRK